MERTLREDAEQIVRAAIAAVCPDEAVRRALETLHLPEHGRLVLVSVGKAGWQMAQAAQAVLVRPLDSGIVVTKYGHVKGELPGIECWEAGHPVPDENSIRATQRVLEQTEGLGPEDTVLFLLSGGGSALFEQPLIPAEELQEVTRQLLACGADIVEMNTIRKRLSAVKGGRFAQWCAPARIEAVVLSDILGDPLDMIASGPAAADPSTAQQAQQIAQKYRLRLSAAAWDCLRQETPKALENVHTQIIGSVRELCRAAEASASALGYHPIYLTDHLSCEARAAGRWLAREARRADYEGKGPCSLIAGGETVVHLTGGGLGGRNQELALAAAEMLDGCEGIAVVSVGSDGTDGPTDAAGGYADGQTCRALARQGIDIQETLRRNDSYHALRAVGGLIFTGPTGTNVNDVAVALVRGRAPAHKPIVDV